MKSTFGQLLLCALAFSLKASAPKQHELLGNITVLAQWESAVLSFANGKFYRPGELLMASEWASFKTASSWTAAHPFPCCVDSARSESPYVSGYWGCYICQIRHLSCNVHPACRTTHTFKLQGTWMPAPTKNANHSNVNFVLHGRRIQEHGAQIWEGWKV